MTDETDTDDEERPDDVESGQGETADDGMDWPEGEDQPADDMGWVEEGDESADGMEWEGDGDAADGMEWAGSEGDAVDGMEWTAGDDDAVDGMEWAEADGDADAADPFPAPAEESDQSDADDPLVAPGEDGDVEPPLADEEMDDAFDDVAVDEVEADEVWADVTDEEREDLPADDAPADERVQGGDIAEVSKHDYCETCEFFSEAPEIHCTNDGTEILDFADMETVRVSNCPVVAERQGLDEGVAKGSTDLGEMERE